MKHFFRLKGAAAERMDAFRSEIPDHEIHRTATEEIPRIDGRSGRGKEQTMHRQQNPDQIRVAARTDRGRVRASNQDAVISASPLFGVADGMGGHLGGEVASSSCRDGIIELLSGRDPEKETMIQAVKIVNRRLFIRSQEDENLRGMGTTLTLLWAGEDRMHLAHVGDSRCYLLRDGELSQVSEDHSMVMEMVRAGILGRDEVRNHPMRNIITRAVGTEVLVDVDYLERERREGDRWLICSDGLHGLVSEDDLKRMMQETDLDQAADHLMQAAMQAGGTDNISLVLLSDREAVQ